MTGAGWQRRDAHRGLVDRSRKAKDAVRGNHNSRLSAPLLQTSDFPLVSCDVAIPVRVRLAKNVDPLPKVKDFYRSGWVLDNGALRSAIAPRTTI